VVNTETVRVVYDRLVNAEGLMQGIHKELGRKEEDDLEVKPERERVGGLLQDLARLRREWEYWFVPHQGLSDDADYNQEELPF